MKCKHCGRRIVRVNFSLGPGWMHQPEGAAFQDGMYSFCHSTTAEPEASERDTTCPQCRQRLPHHKLSCGERTDGAVRLTVTTEAGESRDQL